ncbi:hypothetical protein E2C01_049573 [Portunus trituberculatus]|uniref:Uncharacterized protein n=1 Tax=Portunus trituberculatus TaxID=210409 RepID=A0A5B7G6S4_PORTR|nr:hypothetical protein [Portunus trituberculatus]
MQMCEWDVSFTIPDVAASLPSPGCMWCRGGNGGAAVLVTLEEEKEEAIPVTAAAVLTLTVDPRDPT